MEESTTGRDAIARAHALPPDLVLGDTQLPDMGGLEVAVHLKQDVALAQVPFVALGHEAGEQELALAAGCDGFIARPFDPSPFCGAGAFVPAGKGRLHRARRGSADGRGRSPALGVHARSGARALDATHPARRIPQDLCCRSAWARSPPSSGRSRRGWPSAVTKLSRIVDNLADFANLEAGPAAITPSPVDPDALAEEVVEELREAARDARLHLEVRPSRGGAGAGRRSQAAAGAGQRGAQRREVLAPRR